jgi:hypothetical protein
VPATVPTGDHVIAAAVKVKPPPLQFARLSAPIGVADAGFDTGEPKRRGHSSYGKKGARFHGFGLLAHPADKRCGFVAEFAEGSATALPRVHGFAQDFHIRTK